MKQKQQIGLYVLIALTSLIIVLRFGAYFQTPGKVIEPYGDGFKAYTVIAYHAKHDSTWTYFEGMNYPYGDHIVPSACQPLISNSIKFISNTIVDISDWTIPIVNLSMLLTILLGALFLYLILTELGLPVILAIPIAIGITFLSPQIHRMHAHYGLSHIVVLPVLLYLLMHFSRTFSWRTSIWIGITVLLLPLIHFYYFAIMGATIMAHFFFLFLRQSGWKNIRQYLFHFTIQLLIPLVFFVFWINLLDPVEDRSNFPWGFFHYISVADGIFLSPDQPHWKWLFELIKGRVPSHFEQFEGRSYIGLVGIISLLGILIGWGRRRFSLPMIKLDTNYDGFLNDIFYASIILLLFSFCLPFAISGLEFLVDFAGPVRQFRSLGRFAWLFYYVINIVGWVWLYKQLSKKSVAIIWIFIAFIWMEAAFHTWSVQLDLDEVKEFETGQRFTDIGNINFDDYQAIITVPYYHIGSEIFWREPEGFILQKSLTLSLQTGLPTTSAMLTRSSRGQTVKQMQLVGEPYQVPTILDDLPSEKPFLLVWDEREFKKTPERFTHLREGLRLVYSEGPRLRMYELPVDIFTERIEERAKQVREEVKESSMVEVGDFLVQTVDDFVLYDGFDRYPNVRAYHGAGSMAFEIGESSPISLTSFVKEPEAPFTLSMWMDIAPDLHARSNILLTERDTNGVDLQIYTLPIQANMHLFDDQWGLIEFDFIPKSSNSSFMVSFDNPDIRGEAIIVDELLIRKKDRNVWRQSGELIMKNNRYWLMEKE